MMKQYLIDEIRLQDYGKIKAYLDDAFGGLGVDGLYWLPVDEAMLSEVQKDHTACGPFFMALELEEDRLSGELLLGTEFEKFPKTTRLKLDRLVPMMSTALGKKKFSLITRRGFGCYSCHLGPDGPMFGN